MNGPSGRKRFPGPATACTILFALLGPVTPALGQTVRGSLTEEGSGVPIEGALVVLLPAGADSAAAATLTDSAGGFRLRATPGHWRLRADRIGHRSVLSPPFELGPATDTTIPLAALPEALPVEPLDVLAASRGCTARPEGAATAALWDDVRKALENAYWAREREMIAYDALLYERSLDPSSLSVVDEESEVRRGAGNRPFSSMAPQWLAEHGFVEATDSGTYYFAPDERVLLSDAFLDGHCFRFTRTEPESELVGLAFEPIGGRNVDIAGVLWLDEETRELRFLEYRYVNLRVGVPTERIGGHVEFQRLPTGAWIARRWWIRMPEIAVERTTRLGREIELRTLSGIHERGGEVVAVETRSGGRIAELDRPRVQGVVYDSARGRPLEGADVFLLGTDRSTRTDAQGRFTLSTEAGDYSLAFHHPRVDSTGFQPPPLPLHMRPGVVRQVRLAIPTESSLIRIACGPNANGGILAGTVRNGVQAAMTGATVELSWRTGDGVERREARADDGGRFVFCAAPAGTALYVRALHGGATSASSTLELSAGEVARASLRVDSLRTGRVRGRVVDTGTGSPVERAVVRVSRTGVEGLTDHDGRFTLGDAPPGPQLIEIEHLTYGDHADSVRIVGDSTVTVTLAITPAAIGLQPLTVTAERRPRTPGLAGFFERMEGGGGYFMTAEQIARRQPQRLSEVLRAVPGLSVTCGNASILGSGCIMQFDRARTMDVRGRERECPVQYFLDGSRVSVEILEAIAPGQIAGLEVYSGLADVPPRFQRGPDTRCGVIAMWLKERG